MQSILINYSFASMVLALLSYATFSVSRRELLGKLSTGVFSLSFLLLSWFLIDRWIAAGRSPWSNMYESIILMAWIASALYLVLEQVYAVRALGVVMTLVNVVAITVASMFDEAIRPLVPALQSYWLKFHVLTVMSGYAAFTVAFAASVYYLIVRYARTSKSKKAGESLERRRERLADVQIYQNFSTAAMRFGFLTLIVGIFLGGVWAAEAWGRWWGWDPKETWALITWLVYLFGLHVKYVPGRLGIKDMNHFYAWLAVGGYIVTLFTYFGVNLWISGLHSYA